MTERAVLFITGTDTGVGKTHVTCLIASSLRNRCKVGVMKPVESGCRKEEGRLIPADAVRLREAAGCPLPVETICPYPLSLPLAPAEAARRDGNAVDMEVIRKAYDAIRAASDVVLVEGAGGLLTPFRDKMLYADLVKELNAPLLVVAGGNLGTVNHTLLTLECAASRGIRIASVVVNEQVPLSGDPSFAGNAELLRGLTSVPVHGPLPFLREEPSANATARKVMAGLLHCLFPGRVSGHGAALKEHPGGST